MSSCSSGWVLGLPARPPDFQRHAGATFVLSTSFDELDRRRLHALFGDTRTLCEISPPDELSIAVTNEGIHDFSDDAVGPCGTGPRHRSRRPFRIAIVCLAAQI